MTDLIDLTQLRFTERPWSFLAHSTHEGRDIVVKVPKGTRSTDLSAALAGVEERRLATNEWETLRTLASFNSDRVSVPVCVALLADAPAILTEHVEGLTPLARLLRDRPLAWASSLASVGAWLARIHAETPGSVIDGLKLDNIDVAADGACVLFDPNELMDGPPARDVARLCVSLLAWSPHRILPAKRGRLAASAFLLGYEQVDGGELQVEFERWVERASDEARVALRRRMPFGLQPFVELLVRWRERRVRIGAGSLLARFESFEDTIDGRYDSPQDAQVYRRQQEGLSFRGLRLSVLARLEVASVRREIRRCNAAGTVLDLPGGTGKLWPMLVQEGLSVVAGDRSASMLEATTPSPRVRRVVMDGKAIPYPENAFDGSVSLRLLHRLPSLERVQILRELARVSQRWVVGSVARSDGLYRLRHALRTSLNRSRAWAPHPASPSELEMELAVAGLRLRCFKSIASLLSNEAVFLADAASPTSLVSPPELICPACRAKLRVSECPECGRHFGGAASIPDMRPGTVTGSK